MIYCDCVLVQLDYPQLFGFLHDYLRFMQYFFDYHRFLKNILKSRYLTSEIQDLREEIYGIFETEGLSKEEAKEEIDEWCKKANLFETKGFNPFTSFTKTYMNFEENILNYFTKRISSGPVEGLNNKIKVIKRRGFGFRNIANFAKRLFLDINYKHLFLPTPAN